VAGRVIAVEARVGDTVHAGDVLFTLDSESERLTLEEARERIDDLESRIAALDNQITEEQEAVDADREATEAARTEARAWAREAQARADRAEEQAEQLENLVDRGLASGDDLRQAQSDHTAAEAEVEARRAQSRRMDREGDVRVEDRESAIAELQRERIELEGQQAIERRSLERLEHDVDLHSVRAPVDGRIGELLDVRVGSVVEVGELLGEIIPEGELHVVAYFPIEAAGRLERDQSARLRFPGYPWTQFGTVRARVTSVSQEPVDNRIRLELAIETSPSSPIPMEHSLPTIVEVEVERISPLELLFRTAGKWVDGSL